MNAPANINMLTIGNLDHIRATLNRISLLSVYAAMSVASAVSRPSVALLEKTFIQIHDDSSDMVDRLDASQDDSALMRESFSTFESISLLSIFAGLAAPSHPSTALLEQVFNRIYETCEALVSKLDDAEATA